ncbi:zeta toxin family protein [Microbacterium sp. F2]|uniref:zeta toxin family protein n=1 Tax=Microbacterium sp. F2 TaxID=3422228 RepID=UPI003FD05791
MSDASLGGAAEELFEERVAPVLFAGRSAESSPVLTIVVGQPGAAPLRAASRVTTSSGVPPVVLAGQELAAFHPRFTESVLGDSEGARGEVAAAAAVWTRMVLRRARAERLSLVLDGSRLSTDVAVATAGLFAADGFSTTVAVMAAPRVETLLSTVSKHLISAAQGRWSPLVTLEEHDAGFDRTAELVRVVEASSSVERVVVVGRGGEMRFDSARDGAERLGGATAELEAARSEPVPAPAGRRWLTELRAATDFALSTGRIDAPLGAVLGELHEVALREVVPSLGLPADSLARPILEQTLTARAAAIRDAIPTAAAHPAPRQPAPQVGGPEPEVGPSI